MARRSKSQRLKSRDPGSFKGLLVRMNLDGWRELRILAAERDTCAYRKSHPAILMVQSTQDRVADDIPGPLNAARDRGIFVQ
jgi:hypothetical protein